jgi:hypothetical protein
MVNNTKDLPACKDCTAKALDLAAVQRDLSVFCSNLALGTDAALRFQNVDGLVYGSASFLSTLGCLITFEERPSPMAHRAPCFPLLTCQGQ